MATLHELATLEQLCLSFGAEAGARKLRALHRLRGAVLPTARAVRRLHEALCVVRTYPDSAALADLARQMLEAFARRADLRRHRQELADTGIAGTRIHYRFFAGQAQWLARRWPQQLRLDRRDTAAEARIALALPALLSVAEAQALIELKLPGYAALDRLRPPDVADATFLLQRIAALPGNSYVREAWSDALDASHVLEPGPDTPSRTLAFDSRAPVAHRSTPPPLQRPELRVELARAPRIVQALSPRRAAALIDLARCAMVTRARSLEAFSFAHPRDAWFIDDGDGLAFALFGVEPERRHVLAGWYGGLVLRNGVPIGYVQSDHFGHAAALSFNVFETFRGGEAAFTFARWLAAQHALFGTRSFSIEPYQLGAGNDEALDSGAWWFYAKLGFAPRDAATLALARDEKARLRHSPGARSSRATLRRLAGQHLFFDLDARRPAPLVPLAAIGLAAGAALSRRAAADRECASQAVCRDVLSACGQTSMRGWNASERRSLHRMAPVLALLDIADWPQPDRTALLDIVRAKAAPSERGFVQRVQQHRRLIEALASVRAR